MARKIDEDKIKRIKEATMKTIVDFGIESTTIAMIAKNANVSGGYLYRTYSGKQELINELFYEKVIALNNELAFLLSLNPTSIQPLLKTFIANRIVYFINEPTASNFFYQLLHNDNFKLTGDLKQSVVNMMQKIKSIGIKSGEISEKITLFNLYFYILIYPVDYIHFKRKNIFESNVINTNDITSLTSTILNILKN